MEKVKKFLINVLIVAYAIVAVAVTILLLSYNQYHCSVLGGYTFILVTDEELEPNYNEGDLVLVKETKAKNIKPGDYIFLYRNISATQFEIKHAQVLLKDTARGENNVSYVLEGSVVVDHEDVIGSAEKAIVVPHLGTILSILESRYGYLFLIVVVSFIAFLYEIYELIMEIKYGDREEDDEDYDDDDDYDYDDDDYDEDDDDEYEEVVVRRRKKKVAESKPVARKTATTRKASTSSKTTATRAKSKATYAEETKGAKTAKATTRAASTRTTGTRSTGTKSTAKTGATKKATTTKKTTTVKEK